MAEFKKLSEVEVVAEPTESANVLIEEDGVIKKAPKTAVGGGSGDVSWNDLTDKPFYEIAGETIFDETVDFNDDDSYGFANALPLVNGNPYTVFIDGVEYNTIAYYESPDIYLSPIPEVDGEDFMIYDYGLHHDSRGIHTLKIVDQTNAYIKQIDEKFVPGLPILIKVYQEAITDSVVEYRCDLTEGEIEQLMAQGRFLYVAIYFNNGNDWIMNTSLGFFYCDCYSYPDDDRVIFTSPDGKRRIVFSSLGTVTYTQS